MQGWWSVRCGDALAWVEAPSAPRALRRSLDLHPLGRLDRCARQLVVFPQDAYPDHAGRHDYTWAVLNAEPPLLERRRAPPRGPGSSLAARRREPSLQDCDNRTSNSLGTFGAETIISMSGGAKARGFRTVPISDWRGCEFANGGNWPAGLASGPDVRPPSRGHWGTACVFLPVLPMIHSRGPCMPGLP